MILLDHLWTLEKLARDEKIRAPLFSNAACALAQLVYLLVQALVSIFLLGGQRLH